MTWMEGPHFFADTLSKLRKPVMKLIRKGNIGAETSGLLLQDGREVNVSAFGEDFDEAFFNSSGIERLKEWA